MFKTVMYCKNMEELYTWYDEKIETARMENKAISNIVDIVKRHYPIEFNDNMANVILDLSEDRFQEDFEYAERMFTYRSSDFED